LIVQLTVFPQAISDYKSTNTGVSGTSEYYFGQVTDLGVSGNSEYYFGQVTDLGVSGTSEYYFGQVTDGVSGNSEYCSRNIE
jgi:hypothetical protein